MAGNSRIDQKDIPTLPNLYADGEIKPSTGSTIFSPSTELNKKIGLIRHDITKLVLPNGAIVNAANKSLLGGGGVDGAIHRAAGPGVLEECEKLNGCETGSAKITGAYEIPCKNIIHTVGPIYDHVMDPERLLASCYKTSLDLAVEAGLNAIVFSAISTGVYGYPSMEAADVVLETVREYLESDKGKKLDLVAFCNFEMKDVNAYHLTIPSYFPPPASQTGEAADNTPTKAPAHKNEEGAEEEEVKGVEKATTVELPKDEAVTKKPEAPAEPKGTDTPATAA